MALSALRCQHQSLVLLPMVALASLNYLSRFLSPQGQSAQRAACFCQNDLQALGLAFLMNLSKMWHYSPVGFNQIDPQRWAKIGRPPDLRFCRKPLLHQPNSIIISQEFFQLLFYILAFLPDLCTHLLKILCGQILSEVVAPIAPNNQPNSHLPAAPNFQPADQNDPSVNQGYSGGSINYSFGCLPIMWICVTIGQLLVLKNKVLAH